MSTSRRVFLRTATMVALSAAAHSKLADAAFGQKSVGGSLSTVTGFRVPDESLNDPLTYYTKSTFMAHLNSKFRLRQGDSGSWVVTLAKVDDFVPPPGKLPDEVAAQVGDRECFGLVFSGVNRLPQGNYTVEHGALGTFQLLLVPSGGLGGVLQWDAVINRLYS